MLDFTVTSNHAHLLFVDRDEEVISYHLQVIAGRTAPELKQRKMRKGASWDDRDHATAIKIGVHFWWAVLARVKIPAKLET